MEPRDRCAIVCGGRDYRMTAGDFGQLWGVLRTADIGVVVTGACPTGVDADVMEWLSESMTIDVEKHPAEWDRHGRAAGPIRNENMARLGARVCIAFPGGRGTEHMVARAAAHGIHVVRLGSG